MKNKSIYLKKRIFSIKKYFPYYEDIIFLQKSIWLKIVSKSNISVLFSLEMKKIEEHSRDLQWKWKWKWPRHCKVIWSTHSWDKIPLIKDIVLKVSSCNMLVHWKLLIFFNYKSNFWKKIFFVSIVCHVK